VTYFLTHNAVGCSVETMQMQSSSTSTSSHHHHSYPTAVTQSTQHHNILSQSSGITFHQY